MTTVEKESMERTLHIFYRHVHQRADARSRDPNKARPQWFSYEACFRNLLHTIRTDPQGHRVKVKVMFDGDQADLMGDFVSRYLAVEDVNVSFQYIVAGSDHYSSLITYNHAYQTVTQPEDVIYFLENDYMHQMGWVSKVFELVDSQIPAQYWSLYDHKDKYFLPMYADLQSQLFHTATHHWRTTPSTCGTFLVRRETYEQDYDIFRQGIQDYFLFDKLRRERGRTLVTPVPGLSTHSMEGYLSPTVPWEQLIF